MNLVFVVDFFNRHDGRLHDMDGRSQELSGLWDFMDCPPLGSDYERE